jgi:hypothetical protein
MNANPNHLNATSTSSTPSKFTPEFFPLPQRGQDPHFGLGRSSYYDLEKRGLLSLVRLRKPGNIRGRVLVPYADALAAVRKLSGQDINGAAR